MNSPNADWKNAPDSPGFWWILWKDRTLEIRHFTLDNDSKPYYCDDEGFMNYPVEGQLFLKQPEPQLPCRS